MLLHSFRNNLRSYLWFVPRSLFTWTFVSSQLSHLQRKRDRITKSYVVFWVHRISHSNFLFGWVIFFGHPPPLFRWSSLATSTKSGSGCWIKHILWHLAYWKRCWTFSTCLSSSLIIFTSSYHCLQCYTEYLMETVILIVVRDLGTAPKKQEKRSGKLEIRGRIIWLG